MQMPNNLKWFDILGVNVSAINMGDALGIIQESISKDKHIYICVCPVSTIMECKRNKDVLKSLNSATLVTPDGMSVVLIGRMKGFKNIRRVYGPDLMLEVCRVSEKYGYRNFFYGSTNLVLENLQIKLKQAFPNLIVSGVFSPPFRKPTLAEDKIEVDKINSTHSQILWVGLGSPKQDLWMSEHRDKINCPVMIGVGAAFDFLSGTKPQAPKWIRNSGFEWLFRLTTEPKRLWRRYLVDGSMFLFFLLGELILKQFPQKK